MVEGLTAVRPSRAWSPERLGLFSFSKPFSRASLLMVRTMACFAPSRCVPPSIVRMQLTKLTSVSELVFDHCRATSICNHAKVRHLAAVQCRDCDLQWCGANLWQLRSSASDSTFQTSCTIGSCDRGQLCLNMLTSEDSCCRLKCTQSCNVGPPSVMVWTYSAIPPEN